MTLARAVPTLLQPQVFGKGDLSRDALRADWHLQGPVLSILPCPSWARRIQQELSIQTKSSDSLQLQREPAGRAWQGSLPDFQVKGNK